MSRTLISFPGRAGDIAWMLPTARAIAEQVGPVDLQIAGEFSSLLPLLRLQPYLGHVCANPHWGLSAADSWKAPAPVGTPDGTYDQVLDLGYRRWPELPLPYETYRTATEVCGLSLPPLDLSKPWLTVEGVGLPTDIAVGFTEAWFELKLGLLLSVEQRLRLPLIQLTPEGSRWTTEVPPGTVGVFGCGWVEAARAIRNSDVFFGDCSALHVIAVALGKPVVIMECMEARWNPIFFPLGMDGPQVTVCKGNDGKPTFDARHCADTLKAVLRG